MLELFGGSLPNLPFDMGKHSQANLENNLQFIEMFNRLSELAMIRFKWSGLPASVNERFLNLSLYFYGQVAWFWDDNLGYLAIPCQPAGKYNIYYEPTAVHVFSFTYSKTLFNSWGEEDVPMDPDKNIFEIIRNTPTCTPTAYPVLLYARRLADILRTLDVILTQKKRPWAIECDEKERLTYLNLYKKVKDNEPLILGSKKFNLERNNLNLLPVGNDQSIAEIWQYFQNLMNYTYTLLGIDNPAVDKRERLIVDEVNANNMVNEMATEIILESLQAGCRRVNENFGLQISVEARTDELKSKLLTQQLQAMGGGGNGGLYNHDTGIG